MHSSIVQETFLHTVGEVSEEILVISRVLEGAVKGRGCQRNDPLWSSIELKNSA